MLKEKCGKSKLTVFEYEAQQKVKKQTCDEFEEYSLSMKDFINETSNLLMLLRSLCRKDLRDDQGNML